LSCFTEGERFRESLANRSDSNNPEKSADPGKLYWDGCWPSDQYPLVDENNHGFSIAFIPGRLSDHNLLDDKYVYRLRMMSGAIGRHGTGLLPADSSIGTKSAKCHATDATWSS